MKYTKHFETNFSMILKPSKPLSMKTFKTLSFIFLAMLLLVDCSSKKDDPAPSLVGTWTETSFQRANCISPGDNTADEPCTSLCPMFTFTSDTFSFIDPSGANNYSGTYTATATVITAQSAYFGTRIYQYTLTATTLKLTYNTGDCDRIGKYARQ